MASVGARVWPPVGARGPARAAEAPMGWVFIMRDDVIVWLSSLEANGLGGRRWAQVGASGGQTGRSSLQLWALESARATVQCNRCTQLLVSAGASSHFFQDPTIIYINPLNQDK